MVCIYKANETEDKLPFLAEARERVVVIKLHLRLLHDLKQISLKQYALQAENIESVSRQLAAWQKKYRIEKETAIKQVDCTESQWRLMVLP
jgi:hypothetical protein